MKKQVLPDLLLLIRSMSKAEKRAFRLFSSRYKTADASPKSYLKLYNQLLKHSDDDALPQAKNADQEYLLALLMESLLQQRNHTPEIELRDQLSEVTVLHRRGLEKKALRMLDKLLRQSWESGSYELGLEVVGFHTQLLTSVEHIGEVKRLTMERKKLLQALSLFQEYDELMLQLFDVLQANDMDAIRNFLQLPLLKATPPDVRTKVHRHHIFAHAGIGLHDFKMTEKHHDAIQLLFEQHPAFLRLRTLPYIMIVLNSGILAYHARKTERLKDAIDRLQQLPRMVGPLQLFDKNRIVRYALDLELRYHLLTHHPENGILLAGKIKQVLLHDQQMESHRANYLRYFLALSFYRSNRLKEALQWLQPIIDDRKQGYYNLKTYSLAFLLRAACHFKKVNDATGESLLLAFHRNKFFASTRVQQQFKNLVKEIPKGYDGDEWLL